MTRARFNELYGKAFFHHNFSDQKTLNYTFLFFAVFRNFVKHNEKWIYTVLTFWLRVASMLVHVHELSKEGAFNDKCYVGACVRPLTWNRPEVAYPLRDWKDRRNPEMGQGIAVVGKLLRDGKPESRSGLLLRDERAVWGSTIVPSCYP